MRLTGRAARADMIRLRMDEMVVGEQGGDPACWGVLRDRIEAIVPASEIGGASGFYGEDESAGPVVEEEVLSEEDAQAEALLRTLRERDRGVVQPRRAEIEAAMKGVRLVQMGG